MSAGVIGLGVMGRGMARHLAREGRLAAVWNRTRERAETLAGELGVPVAEDPAALAAACETVIICVSADADVLEVVDALLPGLQPGQVVVDCSTVGVDTVAEAARRTLERGASFLDAPVTGGREGAEAGTLMVMVGGEAGALQQARPDLAPFAAEIVHMGPTGYGQRAKAVNQILAAGVIQAISEALAFADASGLQRERLLPVLAGGAAGSRLLERRGERMLAGDFKPGFRMALHDKDLALCQRLLAELNVNLPLVEMTRKHYALLMARGHGDEDISALYRLKREQFEGGNRRGL